MDDNRTGLWSTFSGFVGTAALTILILWALLCPWPSRAPALTQQTAAPHQPAALAQEPFAQLGAIVTRALPNGIQVKVPENGVEGRLLAWIADGGRTVDQKTWFDFDRLIFETGSATLRPESHDQLHAVAEILKAYPRVKMKIGGYTDNVGQAAANQRLSEQRASNVCNELVELGIARDRLAWEGYGEQYPVADNGTPEGRAKNRRISMRVLEK
jgi:outer membrane protein OmpA-like peptidoglycan-associated protein